MKGSVIIAIDGTSASGKSTNARIVAKELGFLHVDTGAMYRTLAWHCLKTKVNFHNPRSVGAICAHWKAALERIDRQVVLVVGGHCPALELRSAAVSAAVSHVSFVPQVRAWMKKTQRECARFGNLVMEGRDIGSNVFPETDFKYYLDANLEERSKRRESDGVKDNLAARDEIDSQRAASPLMLGLGAKYINTSHQTAAQTSKAILDDIRARMAGSPAPQNLMKAKTLRKQLDRLQQKVRDMRGRRG
jgi:cytidylate kinase